MANSIIQRGTGMAMYFGTLLIVVWLGAAALGDAPFGFVNAVFGFWLVQVILFLATWALFHHMLGGLRHFIWDTTNVMDPAGREIITRIQFGALDCADACGLGADGVVPMIDKATISDPKTHYGHGGTREFIWQRVTGALNAIFLLFFVWFVVRLAGAERAEMVEVVRNPFVGIVLCLLIVNVCVHMRIGMNEVIEDYLDEDKTNRLARIANTVFASLRCRRHDPRGR